MPKDETAAFYNEVLLDYLAWSPALNIHFGFFRKGVNPFDLEAMLVQMNEVVGELLENSRTGSVKWLDVGCGVGATARQLAAQYSGIRITGISNAEKQIALGTELNRQKGFSHSIELVKGDYHRMPFPDDSFDAAYAIESVCYAEGKDKKRLLLELKRVLKPGGILVVADGFIKNNRSLPAFLNRWHLQNLQLWGMQELPVIPLFRQALENAGFQQIESRNISWQVAPSAFHIPVTLLKIRIKRWIRRMEKLSVHQQNYPKALFHTFLLGFFIQYFGYYLISARKENPKPVLIP